MGVNVSQVFDWPVGDCPDRAGTHGEGPVAVTPHAAGVRRNRRPSHWPLAMLVTDDHVRMFMGSQTLSPLGGRSEGVFMRRFLRTRSMRSRETPSLRPIRGSPADAGESLRRQTVPPTVKPSIRKVGCPTPTGTLWPSLPQVPTPESRRMSLPIIEIFLSDSGPLPISVAPLTG